MRRWWQYRRLHRRFGLSFWSVVVGGAPLDPELEAFWTSRALAVIQGYGLTETAPIVTLSHPFRLRAGSVGTPIAGVEVALAEDGEILVRGENVARGYIGAADRETGDGWLHTGDLGAIGAEGQVFIRGRKKDVIVPADGTKVLPEDVERVVEGLGGVREAAAVGVTPGDAAGEQVHVVLVLEPGIDPQAVVGPGQPSAGVAPAHPRRARLAAGDAAAHRRHRQAETHRRPRVAARRRVGRGGAGGGRPGPRRGGALRHGAASPRRTTFDELGLSSLERVELLAALEDAFQTRIDERTFAAARDVGQLRAAVE